MYYAPHDLIRPPRVCSCVKTRPFVLKHSVAAVLVAVMSLEFFMRSNFPYTCRDANSMLPHATQNNMHPVDNLSLSFQK